MARVKLNIRLKPVLFIACEGTSSEFQYFESWAQSVEVLAHYNRVEVYPEKSEKKPKTTPFEMLNIATNVIKSGTADFAWIVFDKDNHPKLPETFHGAVQSNIKIAFSSRSFEQWVLLHYQKSSTPFQATECKDQNDKPTNCGTTTTPACAPTNCLTGYLRRQQFIPAYSKKKDFDLYNVIKTRTEKAVVNSVWLRFATAAQAPLHSLNPYTDVDRLIFKLLDRNDLIVWGNVGTAVSAGSWTMQVTNNGLSLRVQLSHTFLQARVFNDAFRKSAFFKTDDELDHQPCLVTNIAVIDGQNGSINNLLYQGDTLELSLGNDQKPYFLFKDPDHKIFIYIIL
jgi:hypothetical protein